MDYLVHTALLLLVVGGVIYAIDFFFDLGVGRRLTQLISVIVTIAFVLLGLYVVTEFVLGTPAYKITASYLSREIATNKNATFAKYNDKLVAVTGVQAGSDFSSEQPWILIGADDGSSFTIQCLFSGSDASDVETLGTGQQITFKGIFSGEGDDVFLDECSVVE